MTRSFYHSLLVRAVLSVLAVLAVGTVRGDVDRYAGTNWAFVDEKATMAAAADITPAKYSNCDEATVEEKIVEDYRADGTAEDQDEAYLKVLTEQGRQNRQKLEWGFQLPYDVVTVVKLEVIKPSGEVVPVNVEANSKVSIDSSQMESNIYDPNSKVMEVNIPGLEVGDVVHYIARDTTMRSIIPGEFADSNTFEGNGYIRHEVYEIHSPLDKPLKKIVLRDEIPGTVHYTSTPGADGTLVHRWEVANVPRMYDEKSMPPYENVLQRVLVSTLSDWHDVSKWYWTLSQPHLEATTPELKKTVADLTAGATTDTEKMKALFYFVSQKIRYMGLTPEKDRPGFEPHDVCLTFSKQYGVCRDKAALLVSMLRTAGLKAYPVLINVGTKKDKEVPDAGFNHAIVGVELTKGDYVLMDPTDEHARDFLPYHDGNQSYLVAKPDGEGIRLSPVNPPENNLMRIKTTGVLTADGQLQAKSQLWFDGANDDVYRNGFSNMKPDDRRRYFEGRLKQALPGARLTALKLTPENMLDVNTPVQAEIEFTADGLTATGHGKSVVSVPWIGSHFGLVNTLLAGTGLNKRKYPMRTAAACGLREDVSLKLGAGFATADAMPVCPPVDDEGLSYQRSYDVKDGILECSRELKLKSVEFSPAQYAQLKQTLKSLEYDARKTPVLDMMESKIGATTAVADLPAPPPVSSDAVILDSEKNLTVSDAHDAVYHVKYSKHILTYEGKTREAEIKIPFNPSCESVRLIHGTVISAAGQRQEISSDEINVMDAKWTASAKRYTGGKILVANLPGVDIGSTIEVEFEVTTKGKPFIAGFESFRLSDDMDQKTFHLIAPAGLKVENMLTAGSALQATVPASTDGLQSYTWTAQNMKALADEADLPPTWAYMPGVTYFVGDYKAYLKDLADTLRARSAASAKVAALVPQIVGKNAGTLAAVQAIRDYVATSIRLAGPTFTELPLSELSAADTILADGYGHSADRAILLHAMLSAAGFQPEFVLASDLPAIRGIQATATQFPLPDAFNTLLVKLTLDGQTYYLNDTDEYAKLGSTPHDERVGIDLASEDYAVIKAAPDCQNKTETVFSLSFANNGSVQMGIVKHYFGEDYNKKNRYFSELRPEERDRYFQELVSGVAEGAQPVGDLTSQFDTYPGTVKFTVNLDNYAVIDGNYLYFKLPFTPSLYASSGGDRRSLPLLLSSKSDDSIRTEIQLPPGYQQMVIAPKDQSLDGPDGGTARVQSTATTGKFVLTDDFATTPALISPTDYPAMLKVESTLERASGKTFVLEKD
jgi:transglutaminase-like putative cysteine protease